MFGRKKPEVLVVGAGPVGLFTALSLARRGVPVQIVDKEWRTAAHAYALALHAGSLRLLKDLGLLDAVLEQAYPVRSIGLYDGAERRAELGPLDVVVMRPVGVAATAVGTALFIGTLPFTVVTGTWREPAYRLVYRPMKFTFKRPLGEY